MNTMSTQVHITDCLPGQSLILTGFGSLRPDFRRRLMALGLVPGARALYVQKAPLGCPVSLRIANSTIALRLTEIAALTWEQAT